MQVLSSVFKAPLSVSQFSHYFFPGNAFFNHKYHHMIKKIGNLILDFISVGIFSCDNNLSSFFPDFFKNLINTFIKKIICIRAFLRIYFSVAYYFINVIKYFKRILFFKIVGNYIIEKAGVISCMTCSTYLLNLCNKSLWCIIK